uniref:Uncharacterized protein n=1 Tax=Spongospora subterranea TaxID=70186 RepID=A0A0H5RC05_9EUKA|eukprot:CRZ11770.1 hypothetical protein [Spongospora subterranea]
MVESSHRRLVCLLASIMFVIMLIWIKDSSLRYDLIDVGPFHEPRSDPTYTSKYFDISLRPEMDSVFVLAKIARNHSYLTVQVYTRRPDCVRNGSYCSYRFYAEGDEAFGGALHPASSGTNSDSVAKFLSNPIKIWSNPMSLAISTIVACPANPFPQTNVHYELISNPYIQIQFQNITSDIGLNRDHLRNCSRDSLQDFRWVSASRVRSEGSMIDPREYSVNPYFEQQYVLVPEQCRDHWITSDEIMKALDGKGLDIVLVGTSRMRELFNDFNVAFDSTDNLIAPGYEDSWAKVNDQINIGHCFTVIKRHQQRTVDWIRERFIHFANEHNICGDGDDRIQVIVVSFGIWEAMIFPVDDPDTYFHNYTDTIISAILDRCTKRNEKVMIMTQPYQHEWFQPVPDQDQIMGSDPVRIGWIVESARFPFLTKMNRVWERIASDHDLTLINAGDITAGRRRAAVDNLHYRVNPDTIRGNEVSLAILQRILYHLVRFATDQ